MFVVRAQRLVSGASGALLGLVLPLVLSLPVTVAGCSFPSPEACALTCGEDGACPVGLECQPQTNLCAPQGRAIPCTLRDEGPAAPPDTDAGNGGTSAGGAGNTPAPDSGSAGSNTAGASGSGPGPDALVIIDESPSDESSCTDVQLLRLLRAAGGTGPYAWRLLEGPSGVALSGGSGEAQLSGVPREPGPVRVELEDGSGEVVEAEVVIVHEAPEVETLGLPAYCVGASYAAELVASGGDGADYVWSAQLLPESGQPGTLGELGLQVDGARLSGELGAEDALGTFRLTLVASDTHCSSAEVELELDIEPAGSDECPSVGVLDFALDELPPACLGSAFSATLRVEGGEPPYTWTELSVPPGLFFDAESATLQGVAEGNGLFTVALSDGGSRTLQKSYDLEARDSCWLAYVASEPSPARLELVDGRLLEHQPAASRRSFPPGEGADAVQDFEFSPDGRFIAYRLGADPGALRLELTRLSDGLTRPLDIAGSVTAFAWSKDASTLAVVFSSGAQAFVGGVDVVASSPLVPKEVTSADAALLWFAPSRLAMLARDPGLPGRRRLVTLARGPAGFDTPVVRNELDFSDAARLLDGAGGVFVAEPEAGNHYFFASNGSAPVAHGEELVLAASGGWAGVARAGGLQLFRPGDPSGPLATPALGVPGCSAVIGWAKGVDRIACVDPRSGSNAVVWFDAFTTPNPSLVELAPLAAPYVYPAGVFSGRRRVFSRNGRWFAFASDETVHVARLDGDSPELSLILPSAALGVRPGVMLFSPDEAQLLLGAGNSLGLVGLEPAAELRLLGVTALFDETCSERFVDGSGTWCGTESGPPDLAWSPGSDLVVFRSTLGTLQLVDVSHARGGQVPAAMSPDGVCSEACRSAQTARFQP
jgi:hypothetical protein